MALMVWFKKTILEPDHMKIQSTNLFHLLIFNILNIYVCNVNIIWFTANKWATTHRLRTTDLHIKIHGLLTYLLFLSII
jgi:hypothetical protein